MPKQGPDGRFVAYLCHRCHDQGKLICGSCNGSGEGRWGDPGRSKCLECNGSGVVDCPEDMHDAERSE
ncbi:MAG: hypothetical protein ACYTBJ_01750 [Planctomycetota bacterium]|jgi:hypothetical protein